MPRPESHLGPDDSPTPLEHRLLGWRPSTGGLDRDRMLFEAGRASARSGPRVGPWHASTAALATLSMALGLALLDARADRRELHRALLARQSSPEPTPPAPAPSEPAAPPALVEPTPPDPSSYLALARRFASGDWLDAPPPPPSRDPDADPPLPSPPTLRVGDFGAVLGL